MEKIKQEKIINKMCNFKVTLLDTFKYDDAGGKMKMKQKIARIAAATMLALNVQANAMRYFPSVKEIQIKKIGDEFSYSADVESHGVRFRKYISNNVTRFVGTVNNNPVVYDIDYKNMMIWRNGIPIEHFGGDEK